MSEREFRFSVTFRTRDGGMFTIRADSAEELNVQYGEIAEWLAALEIDTESHQTPQETREPVYEDGGEVIQRVPEQRGAKVQMRCQTCNQNHDFYVNQRKRDGAYFLSVKRGNDFHYPVDGPIEWVPA